MYSDLYDEVEKLLTADDIKALESLIEICDDKAVKRLLSSRLELDIGSRSIHAVRALARKMNIVYYTKYTKHELVSIILTLKDKANVRQTQETPV